jgi:hypothetical protein
LIKWLTQLRPINNNQLKVEALAVEDEVEEEAVEVVVDVVEEEEEEVEEEEEKKNLLEDGSQLPSWEDSSLNVSLRN